MSASFDRAGVRGAPGTMAPDEWQEARVDGTRTADDHRELVRARYAAAATSDDPLGVDCRENPSACGDFGASRYADEERSELPTAATTSSLGCGNPVAVAALRPGETVLDLGSGGGIDVLLSARRVGPDGYAYGVDMTDEMLALARRNAAEAGATNVEFRKGHIEELPLPDASVDVVISNCVVNLSVDKRAVLAEAHRVLRPGGRLGICDVVADDRLTPDERRERGTDVGCIAGALALTEYRDGLRGAGFAEIEVEATHAVADGLSSAIVRAVKPA